MKMTKTNNQIIRFIVIVFKVVGDQRRQVAHVLGGVDYNRLSFGNVATNGREGFSKVEHPVEERAECGELL